MKRFLHAVAALSGLTIGVGLFGVPYVISSVGFGIGLFWIVSVGALVLTVHLLYGEVVAATPGTHRLPGYMARILGAHGKRIVLVIDVVRFWGLQLAYLIVGGKFLFLLLSPYFGGDSVFYSILLFGIVALATFFGLRWVDRIEFFLTWILLGALLVIISRASPYVDAGNFIGHGGRFFSPYGVIIVALAGAPAIPQMWDIVRRNKKVFRASIIVGTLIPIIITAFFAWAVVGVSGGDTSREAIAGLQGFLGERIIALGALAGFFAIITSYLVVALYLQETMRYDFLVRHTPAWIFAVTVPAFLYFAGAKDFIGVIDIVGSVLFGIEGILILVAAVVIVRRKRLKYRGLIITLGIIAGLFFVLGILQKLMYL